MKTQLKLQQPGLIACALLVGLVFSPTVTAQTSGGAATVDSSTNVLNEFMAIPNQGIPRSMVANAQGLVIIPGMVKAGFIAGVRRGKGIVVVRDERGGWKPPMFVTMTGGSIGFQAGINSTDVILVFRTRKSVSGLLSGKFTIGADAAVAAGPVGRQAAAATDGRLQAEILSYSRSRGLFLGVSLDGSVIQIDAAANQAYYRSSGLMADGTPYVAGATLPPSAGRFLAQLATYSSAPVSAPANSLVVGQPAAPQLPPGMAVPGTSTYQLSSPQNGPVTTVPNPGMAFSPAAIPGTMTQAPAGQVAGTPGPLTPAASLATGSPTATTPGQAATSGQTAAQQADSTRLQLVAATQQLGSMLDDTWRQYFSLPTTVFQTNGHPTADSLKQPLARFDRIAGDSQYQTLIERSEFQRVRGLLRTYKDQIQSLSGLADAPPSSPPIGSRPGTSATVR